MYLGEGKGGGVAIMHAYMYVWEHIASLYYRTAWWMFTELCKDAHGPHMC